MWIFNGTGLEYKMYKYCKTLWRVSFEVIKKKNHFTIFFKNYRLNKSDRAFFPCNLEIFDWNDYSYKHTLGIKSLIFKESLNNIEEAKKKQSKIRMTRFVVTGIYYGIVALLWYIVLNRFGVVDLLTDCCTAIVGLFN